jgi:hypothetical protein
LPGSYRRRPDSSVREDTEDYGDCHREVPEPRTLRPEQLPGFIYNRFHRESQAGGAEMGEPAGVAGKGERCDGILGCGHSAPDRAANGRTPGAGRSWIPVGTGGALATSSAAVRAAR